MSIHLSQPIAAYFAADLAQDGAIAQCFTDDAVVKDEGQTYIGLAAIQEWKASSSKKYTYTVEPFATEDKNGKTIVTGKVTGNFPGSPVDLKYAFGLKDNKIVSLEIGL
jgi:hypothetical protein